MTVLRSTTMATCVIIVASGLLEAGPPESLEEIEKLQQRRIELSKAERFTEALDVGRSLVRICERSLGPDHWRCRSLRLVVLENERIVSLPAETLKDLLRFKSQIEQENRTGISYRSVEGLMQIRQQVRTLLGEGPTYLQITGSLIISHWARNETARAEALARELTLAAKSIGESSPEYAYATSLLGFVRTCRGDLSAGAELLRQGAELNLAHYGTGAPLSLGAINRFAYLKLRQGKPVEALLLSGTVVSGYPRAVGTDECKDALAHFTGGMANLALRSNEQARKSLKRFTELSKGYMVPDHPLMLEAAAQLKRLEGSPDVEWLEKQRDRLKQEASELFSEQKYAASVEVLRSLLKHYEENFAPDHFMCQWLRSSIRENVRLAALSREQLTEVFELKSRIETANEDGVSYRSVDRLARSREEVKAVMGEGAFYHKVTEFIIDSLYALNDLARAEQVARELAIAGKSIAASSPEHAAGMSRLGFLLACQGKLREADKLLTESVAINYLHFESQELRFLDSVNRLAYVKLRQGEHVEAMMFSGAVVSAYPRVLKTDDCEDILALFTWGMANAALQRTDAAQQALKRVDELSEGYMAADHPLILEAKAQLKALAAPAVEVSRDTLNRSLSSPQRPITQTP